MEKQEGETPKLTWMAPAICDKKKVGGLGQSKVLGKYMNVKPGGSILNERTSGLSWEKKKKRVDHCLETRSGSGPSYLKKVPAYWNSQELQKRCRGWSYLVMKNQAALGRERSRRGGGGVRKGRCIGKKGKIKKQVRLPGRKSPKGSNRRG